MHHTACTGIHPDFQENERNAFLSSKIHSRSGLKETATQKQLFHRLRTVMSIVSK